MKWIIRLCALALVIVLAFGASLALLPAERISKIATDQLRIVTGRDVAISGDISLTLWPVLGVRASGLEVENAEWAEDGPMLQAENAAIGIDVMSLLRGEVRITYIEAQSPTIRLEQRLDGKASWEFTDADGAAQIETNTSPDREAQAVSIQRLEIRDATLIYDAEGSDLVSHEGVDLRLDWPERMGPAEISAQLRPTDATVTFKASIDGFAGFITGEVRSVSASIANEGGTFGFTGRANTAGAIAGDLTLTTQDTGAFLEQLGVSRIDLPPKLGRSIDLQTELTLTEDRRLALREMTAHLAGNTLTGELDASLNGVPQIIAKLDVGALDLTSAATQNGGQGRTTGDDVLANRSDRSSGWSQSAIDATALASFNGDIALNASSIDFGQFKLGRSRAVLRNENSRMVFELKEVSAYDGQVSGEFVINNRGGLSVGGRMSVDALQMRPLLRDAIDFDRLTGRGDLQLSFLGSGSSVEAIMNSLSGSGSLAIGQGTIEGFDLDRLLSGDITRSGTTIFDDLTATWTIEDGVLSNRDLLFKLKTYSASGEGVIGLGKRTVDYTFTPAALKANDGRGVAIPVRFVGPWQKVSIKPDIEAVLDANIEVEKKELEQKAREKILEKLDLVPEEGSAEEQSLEDQVKEKLLRKLFD